MHFNTFIGLAALVASIEALTITSPAAGSSIDPTKSVTITWTSTASDPSTFDVVLGSSDAYSIGSGDVVARGISTSSGSYTLPANAILTWGGSFYLIAQDGSGKDLGQSGTFKLGSGTNNRVAQTTSDLSSLIFGTEGVTGSATASAITASIPESSLVFSTDGITGSMTATAFPSDSTTLLTSTSAGTTAGRPSNTASETPAQTSLNAQPRLGSDMILSAAGVMAGLVALLA